MISQPILRDDVTRRGFLEQFSKAFLGVSVLGMTPQAQAAAGPAAKAKAVIYIYLRGGLSHIDTFDPKPGRPEMGGVGGDPNECEWRADFGVAAALRQADAPCRARAFDDLDPGRARPRQLPGPYQLFHDADHQPPRPRRMGAQTAWIDQSASPRQRPDQREFAAPGQRLHAVAPGPAADPRPRRRPAELDIGGPCHGDGLHPPNAIDSGTEQRFPIAHA